MNLLYLIFHFSKFLSAFIILNSMKFFGYVHIYIYFRKYHFKKGKETKLKLKYFQNNYSK